MRGGQLPDGTGQGGDDGIRTAPRSSPVHGEPSVPPEGNRAPEIEVPSVELPAALPTLTRGDLVGLALAMLAHGLLVLPLLETDRRVGGAGSDLEAIGVDIVAVAPALDSRATDQTRERASAERAVAALDGIASPASPERPAPDSQRTREAAPANLPAPSSDSPEQQPPDAPKQPRMRPSEAEPLLSLSDSIAAVAQLAAQHGGAAARGLDTIDVVSTVLAAARAGRRDTFGTAVYEALRANPPRPLQGATGKVTVEFRVGASGAADAVRVATSSGNAALDLAAVTAVREARLPAPPADLGPADLVYTMEYTFR